MWPGTAGVAWPECPVVHSHLLNIRIQSSGQPMQLSGNPGHDNKPSSWLNPLSRSTCFFRINSGSYSILCRPNKLYTMTTARPHLYRGYSPTSDIQPAGIPNLSLYMQIVYTFLERGNYLTQFGCEVYRSSITLEKPTVIQYVLPVIISVETDFALTRPMNN